MKEAPRIDAYRHVSFQPAAQEPDPRPGHYYVSCLADSKYGLLLGPFSTHKEALDHVVRVQMKAEVLDPRAVWWSFGTARTADDHPKPGLLNRFFPELFERINHDQEPEPQYYNSPSHEPDHNRGDDR